jgi:hypothetical protein
MDEHDDEFADAVKALDNLEGTRAAKAGAERDRLQARLEAERRHRIAAVDREVATANERDRLRAVVEKALMYGETEAMARGKTPYPDWWFLLNRALDPRERQLDVSPTIGGSIVGKRCDKCGVIEDDDEYPGCGMCAGGRDRTLSDITPTMGGGGTDEAP